MFYVNLAVTTKQKPSVNSQKIKRETTHTTREYHFTKVGRNGKKRMEIQNSQKVSYKGSIMYQ